MDTHDETDKNVDVELEVETLKTDLSTFTKEQGQGSGYLFFAESKLSREPKEWTPPETWSEIYHHSYLVVVGVDTLDDVDADDDDVDAELKVEAPIKSKTHQNMSHFIYTIKKREI